VPLLLGTVQQSVNVRRRIRSSLIDAPLDNATLVQDIQGRSNRHQGRLAFPEDVPVPPASVPGSGDGEFRIGHATSPASSEVRTALNTSSPVRPASLCFFTRAFTASRSAG